MTMFIWMVMLIFEWLINQDHDGKACKVDRRQGEKVVWETNQHTSHNCQSSSPIVTNCHHHCIVSISNRHHHCVASFLSLSSTVSLSTVSRPSPSSHRSCCKTKDPGPLENLSLNASFAQIVHMQMSNISISLEQRLKQNGTISIFLTRG